MYEVRVADNFHYMDLSEIYTLGSYSSWQDAVAAAKAVVDRCLAEYLEQGVTADALFEHYTMFGDDPHIHPVPEGEIIFSAWDYAKQRCLALCS